MLRVRLQTESAHLIGALSDLKNIEFHPRKALNEATFFSATEIKSLATAVCVCVCEE
jgi:hypothetical protein